MEMFPENIRFPLFWFYAYKAVFWYSISFLEWTYQSGDGDLYKKIDTSYTAG